MLPNFIVPDSEQRANGESEAMELGDAKGKLISLTLGINRIIEQESLDVAVLGSTDGESWEETPLLSFPQKFYCGAYTILLDLSEHPDVTHVKATWKMSRWGRGDSKPLFGFYLFAEEATSLAAAAG
jgi:hypothetical protein